MDEEGLAQVKNEEDDDDVFDEIVCKGIKKDMVKEEAREADIFITCKMCNENFDSGTECVHLKNDKTGDLNKDEKLEAPCLNEDVKLKEENMVYSSAHEQEDPIIKLINLEATVKQEEYFDSPECLATNTDFVEYEMGHAKTEDDNYIVYENMKIETIKAEPVDNVASLNSDMSLQDKDSKEDIKPSCSKESQKDFGTKLNHPKPAFSNSSDLVANQNIHAGKKPFRCKFCSKSFGRSGSLTNHEKSHKEKKYKCEVCLRYFSSDSSLAKHIGSHTGSDRRLPTDDPAPTTAEVTKKKTPKRDTRTMERTHRCTFCSKTFLWNSQLVVHHRIHTGEKPFQCQVCLKSFPSKSELLAHGWVHAEEKPLQCSVCSKSFIRASLLEIHQRTHTGERPFQCEQCLKCYFSKIQLAEHVKVHTGEKPFLCKFCPKSFSRSNSLKYHERIHNGEKPYKCTVCSKSFTDSSSLAVHSRIHTGERPFPCEFCGKACITRGELATHERIHTGEKPFICRVCSKPFSTRSNVTKHEKTHFKEK